MNSDAQDIAALLDLPGTQSLSLLLRFGADRTDSDIDLLAIYAQEPPQRQLAVGRLDVFACSVDHARELIKLRDPVVTEPVLQGNRIGGSNDVHGEWRGLLQCRPTSDAIEYLVFRSCTSFGDAPVLLSQQLTDGRARIALTNLSFAASYLGFAQYYHRDTSPYALTLDNLIQGIDPFLARVIQSCRDAKSLRQGNVTDICTGLCADFVEYMVASRSMNRG